MNDNGKQYESSLWGVLEKNGLADLSQFHRANFYDETPLYSRLKDVDFLAHLPVKDANKALLKFSLKFLSAVISYEEHDAPYLAAITVWSGSDDAPIVPNIFVWNRHPERLWGTLELGVVRSPFAKSVKRLDSPRNGLFGLCDIYEDLAAPAQMSRVFIGPSVSPYKGFVLLHQFLEPLAAKV